MPLLCIQAGKHSCMVANGVNVLATVEVCLNGRVQASCQVDKITRMQNYYVE
jgi:hypothetical protein